MARNTTGSNIRLGAFVFAGALFLVVMLYLVGRQENLFSSTFVLKARFPNVQGLQSGNNVRYSGIKVGTVKSVDIINDTTIEVVMRIEQKMQPYLHRNILAGVGTEGFIGNKVLNLSPGHGSAPPVEPGDIIASKRSVDADEMIETLEQTNRDVGVAAAHLRQTIAKLNTSTALWQLLNDQTLPANINASAANIRLATVKTRDMMNDLDQLVAGIREGRGSLGAMIT
ncbi:MAG TPA: MlaD family protein, partial [Chitinophagaceae bacterium]